MFFPPADHLHVHPHVIQAFLHLLDLYAAIKTVLDGPVLDQLQTTFGQFVIFFRLQIDLFRNQVFLIKLFLCFIRPTIPFDFHLQLKHFLMHVQLFLLHRDQGITQEVFFLCQVGFRIEDLHIQILILQFEDLIARLHLCSFFDEDIMHHARLQRTDLNGCHRLYLSTHPNIIVKLSGDHFTDRHRIRIDTKRTHVIPQQQVNHKHHDQRTQPVWHCLFAQHKRKTFLRFYFSIHDSISIYIDPNN